MSQAILESPWGHETYHMCVVKTLEEACVDWTIEKDWDCGGNDIAPDPYVPGKLIYLKNYPGSSGFKVDWKSVKISVWLISQNVMQLQ